MACGERRQGAQVRDTARPSKTSAVVDAKRGVGAGNGGEEQNDLPRCKCAPQVTNLVVFLRGFNELISDLFFVDVVSSGKL